MKNYKNYIEYRIFEVKNEKILKYIADKNEKLFLEIAHLDKLEIKFNLIEQNNLIFYFYKYIILFCFNKTGKFQMNGYEIWMAFDDIYINTKIITKTLIEKYFNLNNIDTNYNNFNDYDYDILKQPNLK